VRGLMPEATASMLRRSSGDRDSEVAQQEERPLAQTIRILAADGA